jgi:hypothetical protein
MDVMRRRQFLEIHEQPWCPAAVRNGATDCLHLIANLTHPYRFVTPKLCAALLQSGAQSVVDLCSGSGGPWRTLHRELDGYVDVVWLTDLYPNLAAQQAALRESGGRIRGYPAPVDATQPPPELTGFRTLFTAFHHFSPATARAVLQDAVDQGQGIGVFEQTRRSPVALAVMMLLPLIALLAAPLFRPWRIERFFWTYLIPAIPLVLWVDGLVSCLRTYSVEEMSALVAELEGPIYDWEIGRLPSPISPIGVTYAIGAPRPAAAGRGRATPRVACTT